MTPIRVCFVGDSITLGQGDLSGLGWVGRAVQTARDAGSTMTAYNLGVRGDTSTDVRQRWRAEIDVRLVSPDHPVVVFAFGLNDCAIRDGRDLRVSRARTVQNTESILREAITRATTLFVGPAPVDDSRLPPQLIPGATYSVSNQEIWERGAAIAAVAARMGVPYLDMFDTVRERQDWRAALRVGDGVHPLSLGYEVMSQAFASWDDWQALLSAETQGPNR